MKIQCDKVLDVYEWGALKHMLEVIKGSGRMALAGRALRLNGHFGIIHSGANPNQRARAYFGSGEAHFATLGKEGVILDGDQGTTIAEMGKDVDEAFTRALFRELTGDHIPLWEVQEMPAVLREYNGLPVLALTGPMHPLVIGFYGERSLVQEGDLSLPKHTTMHDVMNVVAQGAVWTDVDALDEKGPLLSIVKRGSDTYTKIDKGEWLRDTDGEVVPLPELDPILARDDHYVMLSNEGTNLAAHQRI